MVFFKGLLEGFWKMEVIFPKTAFKIAIWVFFKGLKSKSGYLEGFSKKIPTSISITSTLTVPPPGHHSPSR